MLNINDVIENRRKYPILSGNKDQLFEAIKNKEYDCEYALLTMNIIQKNKEYLFKEYHPDIIIQITSPFSGIGINFILIHLNKYVPLKFMTGIFKGKATDNRKRQFTRDIASTWSLSGNYTDDFNNLIETINLFISNKNSDRKDIFINDYKIFDINNINPLYYTKQAIKIRNELDENDYRLLSEFVDIYTSPTHKNINAKFIDSKNFTYPLIYKNLATAELKKAIKVEKGDIVCLLIGERPKFYLFDDDHGDIFVKAGNYSVLRCKDKKNTSYLVNYLNDEKARMYFSSNVRGSFIPMLSKFDLLNLKVIIPTEEMLNISNETQLYLTNQKKLSPYEVNELIRNSYSDKHNKESQKMITYDMVELISNMKIQVLKELISDDLKEVDTCFENGAYKSAIILCGSILEAILLDWLSEYEDTDDIYNVAKAEDGRDLDLSNIITKLKNIVKPYWYEANKAHEIRKTRNMVHPKECIKNNKKVTYEECEMIINDLKDILESKEERHS